MPGMGDPSHSGKNATGTGRGQCRSSRGGAQRRAVLSSPGPESWRVHLGNGPAAEIVKKVVAKQHINLLVIGTVARTGCEVTAIERHPRPFRVVLTGGPGGGKTTAADLLRREIGDRVIIVPEAATLLFSGGFPRPVDLSTRRPDGSYDFFATVGSAHQRESDRYAAAIFFETAAKGGHGFESENHYRTETQQQAIDLDTRLRELRMPHPRFTHIPHTASFFRKMTVGLGILESLISQISGPRPP